MLSFDDNSRTDDSPVEEQFGLETRQALTIEEVKVCLRLFEELELLHCELDFQVFADMAHPCVAIYPYVVEFGVQLN